MMRLGMILLDPMDKYVYEDGSLPIRPDFDKQFITDMITNKTILCSQNVLDTIPKSMLAVARFTTNELDDYDINWGISTFVDKPDMFLITRAPVAKKLGGKVLRLEDYHIVFKDEKGLEIWVKSTS